MFPDMQPMDPYAGQFTEQQRRIFAYRVGRETLYADPLTIRRRLDYYLGRPLNEVLALANGSDAAARFQAEEDLLRAARLAFDKPWDEATGKGATEEEMRAAVGGLTDFLSGAATSGAMMPPCSPPMDPSLDFPPVMTPA